ncbi:MAG: GIY-YIG nuclease family protein [Bacteroidota bacterium]
MRSGYMYILECGNGSYYVGSTTNLELRIRQHQAGVGAKHTAKNLPVELVYHEFFQEISQAYYREKQVQGWGRMKKLALIEGRLSDLPHLAKGKQT